MCRRWKTWLLAICLLGMALCALESQRILTGWLRGEAFFRGRPSSYWRGSIEKWRGEYFFDFPENVKWYTPRVAEKGKKPIFFPPDLPTNEAVPVPVFRPQTFGTKFHLWLGCLEVDVYSQMPAILQVDPLTEPVLLELTGDSKVNAMAQIALRNLKFLKSNRERGVEIEVYWPLETRIEIEP